MNGASEFAYDLKFKIGPYRFFWIAKRHREFARRNGWNKLWIEKKQKDGSVAIVRGTGKVQS